MNRCKCRQSRRTKPAWNQIRFSWDDPKQGSQHNVHFLASGNHSKCSYTSLSAHGCAVAATEQSDSSSPTSSMHLQTLCRSKIQSIPSTFRLFILSSGDQDRIRILDVVIVLCAQKSTKSKNWYRMSVSGKCFLVLCAGVCSFSAI